MPLPENRIAWFRKSQDWTVRQLSMRLDPEGTGSPSERTIIRWETGETGVPDRWKLKLAELFGVSVPFLMGWEERDDGNGDGGERAAA